MKTKPVIFLRILLTAIVLLAFETGSVLGGSHPSYFWVSYRANPDQVDYPALYVLQIDQFGDVTRQPKQVVGGSKIRLGGGTSIAKKGGDQLNVWTIRGDQRIIRATVDKRTLSLLALKETPLSTSNLYIQVTQRKRNNFMTVAESRDGRKEVVTAHEISDTGRFTGKRWVIGTPFINDIRTCFDCGGVSSDGGVASLVTLTPSLARRQITVQPLGSRGMANGDPIIIFSINPRNRFLSGLDVSRKLDTGERLVAYIAPGNKTTKLFLRLIDPKTGELKGDPIEIARGAVGPAIDPAGHFILFNTEKLSPGTVSLVYQALDRTGHPSGQPKIVIRTAATGLDILKE
jgi:hypothetical protein